MGFTAPTEGKEGRYNNSLQTFTEWQRALWIDVARSHGLDIEDPVKHEERQYHRATREFLAEQVEKYRKESEEMLEDARKYEHLYNELCQIRAGLNDLKINLDGYKKDLKREAEELDAQASDQNGREVYLNTRQKAQDDREKRLDAREKDLDKREKMIGDLELAKKWHEERTGRSIEDDDDPYERVR